MRLVTMIPLTRALTLSLTLASTFGAVSASAAERSDFTGLWITDKGDGAADLRPCGANLCGYIHAILVVANPSKPLLDNNNQNAKQRGRALCGLQIMGGLKKVADDAFGDGWVYDPETGKSYSVEITLQGAGKLAVRGYIGTKIMGKTVEWTRAGGGVARCAAPKTDKAAG